MTNFPKIAIFGCSWSDAYYDDKSDVRHKTWSEYFYDYNPNIEIHNFALSGSSSDFQMGRLISLVGTENRIEDLDAIIFEIPPIHRYWATLSPVGWTSEFGLNGPGYFSEQIREPFHDPVPDNYFSSSVHNRSTYFVSAGHFLRNNSIMDRECPWKVYSGRGVEDYFKFMGMEARHYDEFKNSTMLSSLSNIEILLDIPIYTISFSPYSDTARWENTYNTDFKKILSGGFFPSNIGLNSVLNMFLEKFPDVHDGDWWADQAHPSSKGNKWICDNILMKNDTIRNLVMGNTLDTNQNK